MRYLPIRTQLHISPPKRGKTLTVRIVVGLVILCVSCIAYAQNPAPKVTHRSGAGQFDSAGWAHGEATERKCSVRLPAPFDDFTVKSSDESPQAGDFFVIDAVTPQGIRLAATRASYKNA